MFCSLHMSPLPCRCQTPRGPYCSPVPGRMLEREEICSCDRLRVGHGEGPGIALGIEHCVVLVASALCRGVCDHSFLYICAPSWGWQPCLFPCFPRWGLLLRGPGVIHGLCPPLIISGVLSIHFEDHRVRDGVKASQAHHIRRS